MEMEEFQKLQTQNDELTAQLKKRNAEYIYKLKKQINGALMAEQEVKALNEILVQLVEGQKTGQTAVQLFGTVQECAAKMISQPEKTTAKPLKKWQIWLDNTLILFTVLAGFSAIMSLVPSKNPQAAQSMMRITSLLISAMAGGIVFYFFNKYIYQYDLPGGDKSKKPSFGKQMLIMAAGIIVWMLAMQTAMMLPSFLNPSIPAIALILIAAASYGVRYYMRKKYGYNSSMFSFSQQPTKK